jgi:hypothetical protein
VFGVTGGSFFSVGVKANTTAAAAANLALLFLVPLVILGSLAQGVEILRPRLPKTAIGMFPLAGVIVGMITWWLVGPDDADPLPGRVLGIAMGVAFALLSAIYWVVLAVTAGVWPTSDCVRMSYEARRRRTRG